MRSEQFIGLKVKGNQFLYANCVTKRVQRFEDGRKVSDYRVIKEFPGKYTRYMAFSDKSYTLPGYKTNDGKIIYEKVQKEPWSSGPVIFTYLVDENENPIEESIWSEEEIEKQL